VSRIFRIFLYKLYTWLSYEKFLTIRMAKKIARTSPKDCNATRAFSLIDELSAKYPQGQYGKRAIRDKESIRESIKDHPEWFVTEPNQPETNNLLGFALPATAIGAVVILAIGGIFLYKKKAKSTTK
jgi:hypothetical protein